MTENKKCQICDYNWTSNKRKKIECSNCKKEACLECYKNYLFMGNFTCMFCGIEKDIDTLCRESNSIPSIIKKIFEMKADNFLQQEKKFICRYEEYKLITDNLQKEKTKTLTEIHKLRENIRYLNEQIDQHRTMMTIKERNYNKQVTKLKDINYVKKLTNYKCFSPVCVGYLNNDFNCSLCKKNYCKECNKELLADHQCKKEDIETVEYIKNNSVACPKCGERISKIEGCDQMYCDPKDNGIGCGTVFSYKTGNLIITDHIHNPHYLNKKKNLKQGDFTALNIFQFTTMWDWIYRFRFSTYSDVLKEFFRQLWSQRDKMLERKEKFFSQKNIDLEYFTLGLTLYDNPEEWKKNITILIKKTHNFPALEELWGIMIEEIEKSIYDFIKTFGPETKLTGDITDFSNRYLRDITENLIKKCEEINAKIANKPTKVLKKHYIDISIVPVYKLPCIYLK